ncbi:uncharacterized protein LOC125704082 isoform X2 [Brienomyrus brachyistius]|uniref:uncharacterized protein LOC125704082 isoform X2 n=1 Tax=Brienomyrus brachyistius TaxID=42636 RepID=UPI0020B3806F|nr:uncharacterized protein LOC125704082 isoform X2 [Brienomyrus brachyistius]
MILYRINLTKLILVFGLFRDDCAGEEVFALLGGQAELDPKVGRTQISSITWKSGSRKAAEWDGSDTEVDYYKICENKCELNNITGVLKVKLLMADDNNNYSVEINGKGPPAHFQLTVLSPVPKPSITHTCNETACTLSCGGEDAKHTSWKFLWKENEKESSSERVLTVWKSDHLNKTYTCICRNPLSEAESESISEKDLFPQNSLQGKSWILTLAVASLAFAVLLITGVSRYRRVLRRTETMNIIYENTKELGDQNHFDSGVTEAMDIIYENTQELGVQNRCQSGVTGTDVISVDDTVKGSRIQNHQCSAVTGEKQADYNAGCLRTQNF